MIGSLSNDDGTATRMAKKKNKTKQSVHIGKTTTLHVLHAFVFIS